MKFQVKIEDDKFSEQGEKYLSVSHNGQQWYSYSLKPEEMEEIIRILQEELKRLKKE